MICSFSQVLLLTKQRCLLPISAMLVQKGRVSSSTSGSFETMNNELTLSGRNCVGVRAIPFLTTDTLIIIATTMHGFNSGIYSGTGAPEALSSSIPCIRSDFFPQKTSEPHPSSILRLTLQDKLNHRT